MFGIDDMILLPIIGGAMGGLLNKKNPLQGALLGAAGGYAGGLLSAPSAIGATGGATGLTTGAMNAPLGLANAPAATFGSGAVGLSGSAPTLGLKAAEGSLAPALTATATQAPAQIAAASPGLMSQVAEVAKPIGTAATTAAAVKTLMPQKNPIVTPPIAPATPSAGFNTTMQDILAKQQATRDDQAKLRQRRYSLLGVA